MGLLGGLAIGTLHRVLGPQRVMRAAFALAAGWCSKTRMHGWTLIKAPALRIAEKSRIESQGSGWNTLVASHFGRAIV